MILCSTKDCHAQADVRIVNRTTKKDYPMGKAVCLGHVHLSKDTVKQYFHVDGSVSEERSS